MLDSLALIEHDRSGHEEALRLHKLAGALYLKAGNRPGLASTLLNQGTVHFFAGDLDASETSIDQAREIFEELGDVRGVGLALGNLAIVEMSRGNIERAIQLQEECLRATEAVGDEMGQAIAMDVPLEVSVGVGHSWHDAAH